MDDLDLKPDYQNTHSKGNKILRVLWGVVWRVLFSLSPRSMAYGWRQMLLRLFGAKIGSAVIRPSCVIWAPWNLELGEDVVIDEEVNCYCVAPIKIGTLAIVSREAMLCTASHDISDSNRGLITAPITIGKHAWIAARAFIGPGVTIGEGAVVGACAVVTKDVEPWTVVAGNPARFIKKREMKEEKAE